MQSRHTGLVEDLRSRITGIGKSRINKLEEGVVPFGVAAIDAALPEHGLACGALHEMAGAGPDIEHGCAAALLAAGVLGRRRGTVLWVVERPGLFAPALSQVGLHPDRVMVAQAGRPDGVLLAMEEGLRHRGLAGVVGELGGRLTLTHS
ncbi:MAG: ImuA family protein, partial [Acetobacteraceae bacterium]